ncbi:TonB-dependent receptor [Sphingomonas sp.]|uniref:TonB-dependent receptor n=1 Tax=Sphingomonas sp. TaxID=28214 RepID=UPI002C539C88|nr:TonB-dependent receptor [Sphingomonas sp.]HTG38156.1 TonB-dependent receptor [Sphingomonas sp.]
MKGFTRNKFVTGINGGALRGLLTGGASLAAIALAAPAMAQTTDVETTAPAERDAVPSADASATQDIIVTGIRGSLQRNLDIKRTSPGVVDVISAEDIGKFPDSNVAASLQRLPGVSINRSGSRGEPQGITVRGFAGDFNETLIDGRRLATSSGGRSVDFTTVGSDFVGQLAVLKTPDVTLSSNSIGATVNISYPKPFDKMGDRVAITASGSYQDESESLVPTLGALFSKTFAGDTMGILASAIYTRRDTQTNRVFVSGWQGGLFAPCQLAGSTATACAPNAASTDPTQVPSEIGWYGQQYGADQRYTKDERIDGRLAFQWQASDALLLTVDNNYSRQTINSDAYGFGVWFNQGDLRNVERDENGTTIDFTQAGTPSDFTSNTTSQLRETNQVGVNLKWNPTDRWNFELDGAYSLSKQNPDDRIGDENGNIGYGGTLGTTLGMRVEGDSRNAFPVLTAFGPNGDGSRFIDPAILGSHVTVRSNQRNRDEIKQVRFTGGWDGDQIKLKAGGQYTEDRFQLENRNTFVNNFWQAYAGYGTPSGRTTGVPIPQSLISGQINTGSWIPGFSGALPSPLLAYDARSYQTYLESFGNPYAQNVPGFNYPDPAGSDGLLGYRGTLDLALDPGSVQDIREKTWALYARADFTADLGAMPFRLNAGLRYENTDITSSGLGRVPVSITGSTADPTLLTLAFSDVQAVSTDSNYDYFLPSVDAKLELTENLHIRADASRTLTRPTLGTLTPVLNVGAGQRVGALTATGGNPTLQPYLSWNYDAAIEWYYARNSYAVANFFLKDVSNFVVAGTSQQTINDVIDPTTGQAAVFTVAQNVNGPSAVVRGVELALQHVFGDTGFGFQANATFVETNRPYDPSDLSLSGFAVTGLANSANFVGFYDKNGFQIRGAVNWRDEYLLQFGQAQNNSRFGAEPTFVNEALQVDLSSSWDFTPNTSVFVEALNVFNETQSTRGRFSNQLLEVSAYGRRFTGGFRFRF